TDGSDAQARTCASTARTMSSVSAFNALGRSSVTIPHLPRCSKRTSSITPRSVGSGLDPGLHLGPGALRGSAPRHHPDVAAGNAQLLLVLASHLVHQPRRLAGRGDVVVLGDHVQEARLELAQVDALAADRQGAVHQLVD